MSKNLIEKKIITRKRKLSTIALITLLAISMIMALPAVVAHDPPRTYPTFAYIALTPNPVGVGQTIYVVMWISPNPPAREGFGGDVWRDMKVTVTAPDGTTSTLGPFNSDATGSTFSVFTPTQVGSYKFDLNYPGQVLSALSPEGIPADLNGLRVLSQRLGLPDKTLYIGDTFQGSTASETLTVQQQAIAKIPDTPLPTTYWTRPINGQNSDWNSVASNWLGGAKIGGSGNLWQAGAGPSSPHILWTKPIETGGIVGGTSGWMPNAIVDVGFYSGGSYEGRFTNAMIIDGKLFYADPLGHSNAGGGYTAVDLKTGEVAWHSNELAATIGNIVAVGPNTVRNPSFGQLYNYESQNQHGVVGGILWVVTGTTWSAYDSFTGKFCYNLTNVPAGFQAYDNTGAIVRYILNYNTATKSGSLALWNNSQHNAGLELTAPGQNASVAASTEAYQWRPNGGSFDMGKAYAYSWNVTISADLTALGNPTIVAVLPGDIILGTSTPQIAGFFGVGIDLTPNPFTFWAISDKPGDRGALLWKKDYSAPAGISRTMMNKPIDTVNRVFFTQDTETFAWIGYSLDTGAQLWGPVAGATRAFTYYGSGLGGGQVGFTAYGKLYTQGFGGELCCFNTKDGTLLWKFDQTNSGLETIWGNYPIFIGAIADGKVYAFNNEHSPNYPLYKGEQVYCIDANTGNEIYRMLGWAGQSGGPGTSTMVLADGVVCYYNYYDNQIYAVGKGPSATTVTAPMTAVTVGTNALIQGTVTDQSAGAKGTPAISDADMAVWMENLYMQQPIAGHNVNGVPISIDALTPSGSTIHVGDTTSDAAGQFAFNWAAPQGAGTYTITATFGGSNSYYGSHGQTHMIVATASGSTGTPETKETPFVTYTLIAVIILVILAIIAIVLLLRKK